VGAVGLDRPAALGGQPLRLRLRVDRTDELGRVLERRVVGVDLDHRQQRRERPVEGDEVAELLLDQVADHPLGLRPQDVEREARLLARGGGLESEQPDLRAVAVADHELVLRRDRRQRLRRQADVAPLVLRGHRLAALQERVAAERDDDQHGVSPPASRPAAP